MPRLSSLDGLVRAAAGFKVADLHLAAEPGALAAARRSLDDSGLLLLGETHGVLENPLLIRALMLELSLTSLALEWDEGLAPVIAGFLVGRELADHPALWAGDGRITAGHLAVLAERAAAGPLSLILFDGPIGADWSWSQRDEAMAGRILAAAPPGSRTLVVAGNAHTPTRPTELGVPLGAWLARQRPGLREIRVGYGSGRYYNLGPRRFPAGGPRPRQLRLRERNGVLVLDLPAAREAAVPGRPLAELPPPPFPAAGETQRREPT
ncbi:MAG: hypothetical protein J2P30_22780 [Actinobacteria bacterium]|nr:hypothetical protein [Actinomycetota bacterium]